MPDIILNSDPKPTSTSIFNGNKGLIVTILGAIVIIIIGFSAFMAFGSNEKYQGLIKKVESQTEQLKTSN